MHEKIVLTYHNIRDQKEFEEQIEYLSRKHRDMLVTFDDGYRSVLENALPVLEKYKTRAIMFVNPGLLGEWERMSADEIKQLADGGVTIANHGYSHKPFAGLSSPELKSEYEKARDWINENIKQNAEPEFVALPKGSENSQTRLLLKSFGAHEIFGAERVDVYPGRSLRYFKLSLNPIFQFVRRNKKFVIGLAVLVVLKIFLGFLLLSPQIPNVGLNKAGYTPSGGDDASYIRSSEGIKRGEIFSEENQIGYPALIALTGTQPLVKLNVFVFSPICLVLIALIVLQFFPRKPHYALVASFIFLIFPYIWFALFHSFTLPGLNGEIDYIGLAQSRHLLGTTIMPDWFSVTVFLGGVLAYLYANYFSAGLLLGLAGLIRVQNIIPAILLFIALIILRKYKFSLVYLLGALPFAVLQIFHNLYVTGSITSFPSYTSGTNVSVAADGLGLSNLFGIFSRLYHYYPRLIPIVILGMCLIFFGIYLFRRNREQLLMLIILAIISPAFLFMTAAALRNPRYFLPFIPFFTILTLRIIAAIYERLTIRFPAKKEI